MRTTCLVCVCVLETQPGASPYQLVVSLDPHIQIDNYIYIYMVED